MSESVERHKKRDALRTFFGRKKGEHQPPGPIPTSSLSRPHSVNAPEVPRQNLKPPEVAHEDVKQTTIDASTSLSQREKVGHFEDSKQNIKPAPPDLWALAFEDLRREKPKQVEKFKYCLREHGGYNEDGVQPVANRMAHKAFLSIKTFNESEEAMDGRTAKVRKSFEQIVKIMIASKDAISAITAVNPYATAAWTGVCFVLPPRSRKDAAIEGLDYVVHLMTIYKWYEMVYLSQDALPELINSIENLYAKILEYEATILVHMHQNLPKRWARDVFKAGDWSDRIKTIQTLDARCREITDIIATRRTQQWKEEEQKWQNDLINRPRKDREKKNIRSLYSNYEASKNVNPIPVKGTCKWFLEHTDFLTWRKSRTSSILWVSADPGCGKSVLSKHLVDRKGELLAVSFKNPTICYFFFKDGDEGRRDGAQAMCTILHQLFLQQPHLYRYAEESFEQKGERFLTDFDALWAIFAQATMDKSSREVVCVFDALDECREQSRKSIIAKLVDTYRNSNPKSGQGSVLKILVTSRPYLDIERDFRELTDQFPQVRLAGEDESDSISREIDLVIEAKVQEIALKMDLDAPTQSFLLSRLLRISHRTYLWLHLICNELEDQIEETKDQFEDTIERIPETVDQAYTAILDKIRAHDRPKARKLFHMVLGAARPLSLQEINEAMAVKETCHSHGDLQLWPAEKCKSTLIHLGGLFLRVVDSKIYLIHQTAREFLIDKGNTIKAPVQSLYQSVHWKSSFLPAESNLIFIKACVFYLQLKDFEGFSFDRTRDSKDLYQSRKRERNEMRMLCKEFKFLKYVAEHWPIHFSQATLLHESKVLSNLANRTYDSYPRAFRLWCTVSGLVQINKFGGPGIPDDIPYWTALMVASYFDHEIAVKHLLKCSNFATKFSINTKSALSLAAREGHVGTVRLLLKQSIEDIQMIIALRCAVANGHTDIIKLLCDAGAKVDSQDRDGETPLIMAAHGGYDLAVKPLLEAGAEFDSQDRYGRTPLIRSAAQGHGLVVRSLLEAGAEVNFHDNNDETPLIVAAAEGHHLVVKLLLDAGAKVDSQNQYGQTPLIKAAEWGHELVVKILVEADVKVDFQDIFGNTPLWHAAAAGEELVIKVLLEADAEFDGWTPVVPAIQHGHETVVKLFLEAGAKVSSKNLQGETLLHVAAEYCKEEILELLLEAGAEVDLQNDLGETLLRTAVASNYNEPVGVMKALLRKGTKVNSKDYEGRTPLWEAARRGDETRVKVLLDAHAKINAEGAEAKHGNSPLFVAVGSRHKGVVNLLLQTGTLKTYFMNHYLLLMYQAREMKMKWKNYKDSEEEDDLRKDN